MKTTLSASLTLALFSLSLGCNPRTNILVDGEDFKSNDAVFFEGSVTLDLDGDGQEDDAVSRLVVLISEKQKDSPDLCKLVSQMNASQGDPAVSGALNLILLIAERQHIDQSAVPFESGETLSGVALTDADGVPINGAVSVSSLSKLFGRPLFNLFSPGLGTINIERLRDGALSLEFLDSATFFLNDSGSEPELNPLDFPIEGVIKRADPCGALGAFVPQIVIPAP
jgi:hypothetical protein